MNISYIPFDDSSSSSLPSPHLSHFPLSDLPPISKVLLNQAIKMQLNIGIVLNILHDLNYSAPEDQLINLLLDRYYSSSALPLPNFRDRQLRSSIPSSSPSSAHFNRSESWDIEGGRKREGEASRERGRREAERKEQERNRVIRGLQEERSRRAELGGRRGLREDDEGGRNLERMGDEECIICFLKQGKKAYLSCGHAFCQNCITRYLESLIGEGHVELLCPQDGCGRKIREDEVVRWIWKKRELISKYERFKRNRKIEKDPNLHFCIRPGCDEIVSKNKHDNIGRCICGQEICFLCGNKAHHVTFNKKFIFLKKIRFLLHF